MRKLDNFFDAFVKNCVQGDTSRGQHTYYLQTSTSQLASLLLYEEACKMMLCAHTNKHRCKLIELFEIMEVYRMLYRFGMCCNNKMCSVQQTSPLYVSYLFRYSLCSRGSIHTVNTNQKNQSLKKHNKIDICFPPPSLFVQAIIVIVSAGFLHPLLLEFWLLLQVYHWHFHVHMLSL